MHLPVGTLLQGGRYEILRYISSGGFGCTYEARNVVMDCNVAIKEFFVKDFCNRDKDTNHVVVATENKKALINRLRRKFIEEARALFRMRHPNIVRVTEMFEENGTAYYVMDYIDGQSLASLVEQQGRLSENTALDYIHQVGAALSYVHGSGRLHLDVKPGNIMIDQSGKAVLIDFGVSKQYDEVSGENTSTLMGHTPGYAPIEQSGNSVGDFNAASDIYALGATLYKALTGETPLPASKRASGAKYKELHFPEGLTEATREAVDKAMQLYIDNRPQSIAEFLSMLTENGKVKTASFDNMSSDKSCAVQTQFAPHGSRSASVVKAASPDSEETRLNSKNVVGAGASHTKPVSWQQTDTPVAVAGNERTKSRKSLWIILLLLLIAGGCAWLIFGDSGGNKIEDESPVVDNSFKTRTFTVNGVSFKMVAVEGGTFQMGATSEQEDPESSEKPVHSVTLSDYYIGETEVTQALWQAVMGSNPSWFTGDLQRPVEEVSYKDCETFINKLNSLLANQLPNGLKFRFPTEAQWEYAARGGNRSNGHQYSGSSSVGSVAWYYDANSGSTTHPVKQKQPNELGLYDMSGNVWEWCYDWCDGNYYSNSPQTNPEGPSSGSDRVLRGGSFGNREQDCRVAYRAGGNPDDRYDSRGLRLALISEAEEQHAREEAEKQRFATRSFIIKGVEFTMVAVEGGTYQMGAMSEQEYAADDEFPVHNVTLDDYYIGETEVTQKLWQAVMGTSIKSHAKMGADDVKLYGVGENYPMYYISYYDCEAFVNKLNIMLANQLPNGRKFRLPTEAEWEYAARGGNRSHGYLYSGSNDIDSVAWCNEEWYIGSSHIVKQKQANELGLYDMSGNVYEWCYDWYDKDYYINSPQVNPQGPSSFSSDTTRVLRGGCWNYYGQYCSVTNRAKHTPSSRYETYGLRLAL